MRLTNQLKEAIVEKIVEKSGFHQKAADLMEKEKTWALAEIQKRLPEGFAAIAEKHPEWFPERGECRSEDVTAHGILKLVCHSRAIKFSPIRVPENLSTWCALTLSLSPYAKEAQALVRSKTDLTSSVYGYLNSCTTVEKRVKAYPEMQEFIPKKNAESAVLALPRESFTALLSKHGVTK